MCCLASVSQTGVWSAPFSEQVLCGIGLIASTTVRLPDQRVQTGCAADLGLLAGCHIQWKQVKGAFSGLGLHFAGPHGVCEPESGQTHAGPFHLFPDSSPSSKSRDSSPGGRHPLVETSPASPSLSVMLQVDKNARVCVPHLPGHLLLMVSHCHDHSALHSLQILLRGCSGLATHAQFKMVQTAAMIASCLPPIDLPTYPILRACRLPATTMMLASPMLWTWKSCVPLTACSIPSLAVAYRQQTVMEVRFVAWTVSM